MLHFYSSIPSPSYVLEESVLLRNMEIMKHIQEESGAQILCAFKGYAFWSSFPILKKYLAGATASSLHEAQLCVDEMGCLAHVCAPVYLEKEFDALLDASSHITFNSLAQWDKYKEKTLSHPNKISCALRINPECSDVDTALYNPCMPGSRLGITREVLGDSLPEGIEGLHFHTLCECNADSLESTLKVVEEKFAPHLKQIKWMNMGGGHHITRADYDKGLLIKLIKNFKHKYQVDVILEPGEAIGWETGFLLTTVQDIVQANGISTAIIDASFTAHMPDCLEMPYKPRIRKEHRGGAFVYRIGGMSCLSGDFMDDFRFDEALCVGDQLIFEDMIHYTMVKTTTFNGVNLPSIGIIDTNNSFKLLKTFGYSDYKGRLS